jgi:2-oxoisovalerate dehydrogenase E1 component
MQTTAETTKVKTKIPVDLLKKAYQLMCTAKSLTELYEANKEITAKYVHATSRGHEAVQLALGLQLLPQDFLSAYYRDDSILLGIGMQPYELMLQLLAKRDDPFSGGRTYYSHPSLKRDMTTCPRSRINPARPVCRRSQRPVLPWVSSTWKKIKW